MEKRVYRQEQGTSWAHMAFDPSDDRLTTAAQTLTTKAMTN